MVVQLDFAPPMAEKPTARVVRFIYGDAINPGLQGALAAETGNIAEDL